MIKTDQIKNIRQNGKTARRQRELIKHLAGNTLTPQQTICGRCFDCMGFFSVKVSDCRILNCSRHLSEESTVKIKAATAPFFCSGGIQNGTSSDLKLKIHWTTAPRSKGVL